MKQGKVLTIARRIIKKAPEIAVVIKPVTYSPDELYWSQHEIPNSIGKNDSLQLDAMFRS